MILIRYTIIIILFEIMNSLPNQNNLSFIDVNWLQSTGGLYNSSRVLEYFYRTPFYDRSSDNEILLSQGVQADLEKLRTLNGVQYICDENNGISHSKDLQVHIIKKIKRKSERQHELIDIFYCIDGTFYKAPDFFELVKSRYQKISHHIISAYNKLTENVIYETEETNVFPEEIINEKNNAFIDKKKMQFQNMGLYPSISSIFEDIDVHVNSLLKK